MKVALEAGDVLDIALLEDDRVVGTLSLQLNLGRGIKAGRPAKAAAAPADHGAEAPRKRRGRKPLSAETKARMAAAQKARWEKLRQDSGSDNQSNS